MSDYRVVFEGGWYYPEYWSNTFLKCFSGFKRFEQVNEGGGMSVLCFSSQEAAKLFLDIEKKKVETAKLPKKVVWESSYES